MKEPSPKYNPFKKEHIFSLFSPKIISGILFSYDFLFKFNLFNKATNGELEIKIFIEFPFDVLLFIIFGFWLNKSLYISIISSIISWFVFAIQTWLELSIHPSDKKYPKNLQNFSFIINLAAKVFEVIFLIAKLSIL